MHVKSAFGHDWCSFQNIWKSLWTSQACGSQNILINRFRCLCSGGLSQGNPFLALYLYLIIVTQATRGPVQHLLKFFASPTSRTPCCSSSSSSGPVLSPSHLPRLHTRTLLSHTPHWHTAACQCVKHLLSHSSTETYWGSSHNLTSKSYTSLSQRVGHLAGAEVRCQRIIFYF